jgi:vanillate O-demethylase monooxygenase subunit
MRVPSLPVFEEPPFVWIWGGPPRIASQSRPPRTPWLHEEGWASYSESWEVAANYLMVHEHYLDSSYLPVVHAREVPPGVDRMPAFASVEVTETSVSYTRLLPDRPLADWQKSTGLDPSAVYTHREHGTFVSPAMHIQRWDIEAPDDTTLSAMRIHAIAPEKPERTRVFMQVAHNYPTGDVATDVIRSTVDEFIKRDREILEVATEHVGYDGWQSGVEFRADATVNRARRIVAVMLAKEAGRSATRPGVPASRAKSN